MSVGQYAGLARQIAAKHGIDPNVFLKLIDAESGGNPNARSPAGAVGLTQVVPKWHPGLNLSTPQGQLEAGATILQGNLRQYHGSYRDSLSAYNSGKPWSQGQKIPETRNYVSKILGAGAGPVGVPPAPARPPAPGAAALAAVPALNGRALVGLLNQQRQRVLAGQMPTANYGAQLQKILSAAKPRAQVTAATQQVGAGIAGVGNSVQGQTAGTLAVAAGQAIVKKQIPYSWGGGNTSGPTFGTAQGAGTKGFDCSSFAQYIWAKAGVQIPRTTYQQIHVGQAIPSLAQAKPGDLLFPEAGHVMIFIGNGRAIEEPHTGGHAQVSNISGRSFIAIRRPA